MYIVQIVQYTIFLFKHDFILFACYWAASNLGSYIGTIKIVLSNSSIKIDYKNSSILNDKIPKKLWFQNIVKIVALL